MLSSCSSSPKICFNSLCKLTKSEQWRKGWRLRNGDFAQLCDRCSSAFEELKFCEIFHSDAAGWRNCESCGKRIHCGCIASANIFLHLDAGGIECYPCAKKNFYMASNQMFPSLFLPKNLPEKLKDDSVRPTSIPEHWRQPKAITNNANGQSELHRWMSYEAETPNTVDNLILGSTPSASAHENKKIEEPSKRIKLEALDGFTNGENDSADSKKVVAAESGLMTNSIDGVNVETHRSSFANISQQPSAPYNDPSALLFGLSDSFSSPNERIDPSRVRGALPHHQAPPPQLAKRLYSSPNKGIDSSGEQNQFHGGRLRAEARGRNQLLPRYWPRITDLELQQISGDSNSTITPLFEKILSASDAGRVGRLVLPKKCAEAYFPTISQPEGQTLKVQDVRGKEWVFQFRFWPNNNSRMYVLEGVTPCIQSMQLQAGDTVTFSRMEPEGKLVMGFRKASSIPSEQDIHARKTGSDISTTGHVNNRISKASDIPSSFPLRPSKGGVESNSNSPMNQADPIDPANSLATLDPVSVPKETGPNSLPNKRKKSTLLLKSKRLRIDNDDSMVLKLTWEEAQFLLRPPKVEPSIVIIEGHDFEEYEEAPILGKPTFFTTSTAGEKIQWAQCEHCSKWRKLPGDALMPAHWNCYLNCSWDHERATCEAPQELTTEQLEALFSTKIATSKRKKVKKETDTAETSEGLDTLANVAIFGEGGSLNSSTQATTKHPRHRPGCSCIVCIQPPSGKGPKHKQTCTCNVCLTVRRRFQTLMLRRERRQSEKESESPPKKQKIKLLARKKERRVEQPNNDNNGTLNQIFVKTEEDCDDGFRRESSCLFKGRIDLNIQPEREEELSPISDSISTIRFLQDATDLYSRDQNVDGNMDTNTNQMKLGVNVKEEDPSRGDPPLDPDGDNPPLICASLSTSSPANSQTISSKK